jgi:hypothetical protein
MEDYKAVLAAIAGMRADLDRIFSREDCAWKFKFNDEEVELCNPLQEEEKEAWSELKDRMITAVLQGVFEQAVRTGELEAFAVVQDLRENAERYAESFKLQLASEAYEVENIKNIPLDENSEYVKAQRE